MKKVLIIFLFYGSSFSLFDSSYAVKFIKASTGKSRFGDCLAIIYMSNYLSDKYGLPIIYDDFVESNKLYIQNQIDELKNYNFLNVKKIKIKKENQINLNEPNDIIYEINIDFAFDYQNTKNEKIAEKFRKLINPVNEVLMPCKLNKDYFNVALHVRKGGGFDLPLLSRDGINYEIDSKARCQPNHGIVKSKKYFKYADRRWPDKFPPDSYYIEQLKKVISLVPNKKIHVHIFTDDRNPKALMQKYMKVLDNPNVSFSCRQNDNAHNKNIVDDFFAMTRFDCLIRPVSTYSKGAEMIGDFKIVIWPNKCTWVQKDLLVVEKVNIINNLPH